VVLVAVSGLVAWIVVLSTGTPMFVAGSERWRTQGGNNNAYCLDDPTSWVDWTETDDTESMLAFARRVVHLRANSPALRQPEFFDGRTTPSGRPDLIWLRPDGNELEEADWEQDDRRTLGMWIDGSNSQSRTRDGELLTDNSWLLLMHAGAEPIDVVLPGVEFGETFEPTLDTTTPDGAPASTEPLSAGSSLTMQARSLLLLKAPRAD
jgi:glycogen operon protein